ncbi:MAG: hypothetical protein C4334_06975 [Pyrinomonas sp.]
MLACSPTGTRGANRIVCPDCADNLRAVDHGIRAPVKNQTLARRVGPTVHEKRMRLNDLVCIARLLMFRLAQNARDTLR